MKKQIFTGSGVALVTPMHPEGSVNYEMLSQLIEFQIAQQTDALVIAGTTGESATLSDLEKEALIQHAVKTANKRIPVICGTGSNDTAHSIELSKMAAHAGADGLLLVTPYYNKTSQSGLIRHFYAIADAAGLPCILYNVPSRTGMNILPETCARLAEHPNIVAIKEASGDISQISKIVNAVGNKMAVYSGNDDQTVPILSLGGIGVISVLANIAPLDTHNLCVAYLRGEVGKARRLQLKYLGLISALFADVNPIPVKEAMNQMGFDVGGCRLPLDGANGPVKKMLQEEMKRTGILK